MVPKPSKHNPSLEQNLLFRREVLKHGRSSKRAGRELWGMCKRDPLFFVNTFVWTFDPRLPTARVIPFILYPFQEEALIELISAKGILPGTHAHDVLIEKTRDMGASWICITGDGWAWMFYDHTSFLWLSRKEEYVDKSGDPKSLFWKMDWILDHLPGFLTPVTERMKLHLLNEENGSTIEGESTTGDMGAGDRKTSVLLDEFAKVPEGMAALSATADVTRCRVYNSTPKGSGNAFCLVKESSILKLRFWWPDHPVKGQGLYKSEDGEVKVLDEGFDFPANFPFVLDGKTRSPWYDAECERRASRLEIAQELDIDYQASSGAFFLGELLARIRKEDIRHPLRVGELRFRADYNEAKVDQIRYEDDLRHGRLQLWAFPDATGKLPQDRDYCMGIDVSAGSDASNSCVTLGDALTGEQVGEFVTINVLPTEFAYYCVALARWLGGVGGGSYMVWEGNGPGDEFGKRVLALGYRRVFWRRDQAGGARRKLDAPGWFSTDQMKLSLLGEYRAALASKNFVNRSAEALDEAAKYEYRNMTVTFAPSVNTEDPSGAKYNHGDRVMAQALCWHGMKERRVIRKTEPKIPDRCFAARRAERLQREAAEQEW